jgi:hypothetical protein
MTKVRTGPDCAWVGLAQDAFAGREAQLGVLAPGPAPDRRGLVRRQVVHDHEQPVPAAFAFALGVTAGVLIRRPIPAMAATLAGFAAVQITMADVIRQHLVAPVHAIVALSAANIYGVGNTASGGMLVQARPSVSQTGAWILSSQVIDKTGHLFQGPFTQACLGRNFAKCAASIGQLHLRQRITYLPASRYWTLQWREALIFGAFALLLTGICFWSINRRRVN